MGEDLACNHLAKHGYRVLYRNFRAPGGGEVDVVAREGQTLVFIEVKTRRSLEFGRPSEAVNLKKQRLVARGALAWLRMLDDPEICSRFDVVEVLVSENANPEINVIKDAFPPPEPLIW